MTSPKPPSIADSLAVCTLADGDYFVGAGALANSLYNCGFRGVLWIGYRGPLPDWATSARDLDGYRELEVDPEFAVRFVLLSGSDTLALSKPDFALRVLDELAPDCNGVVFFDADVVVLGAWQFFIDWLNAGVSLCTEIQPFKHTNHPHRQYWRGMIAAIGRTSRDLDWYFNSGFIGVSRQNRDILACWSELVAEYRRRVGQVIPGIRQGERLSPLWATDQEMLNAAAMASNAPLSIIGPEGMDFVSLSLYMSHAIGEKPWRARYLSNAIGGRRPGPADRHFWRFVGAPIVVLQDRVIRRRQLALRIAAAVGRFYGRS